MGTGKQEDGKITTTYRTILCRDNWNPGEGHFVRKGVVGDSLNYFDQQQRKDWDGWAAENLAKLGIREERVLKIFYEYIDRIRKG